MAWEVGGMGPASGGGLLYSIERRKDAGWAKSSHGPTGCWAEI
jgi:hypothetical protein